MNNSKQDIQINIIAKSDKFKNEADKASEKLDKIKRAAYSANLSLLFAGAALQRISQQIMTFGTKAYDDIAHSIVGTVTANDRLAGSMTMLGFSVGEALQPLIEFLIPIVNTFAEWVDENPKLVTGIVAVTAALGTLLALNSSINIITSSLGGLKGGLSGLGKSISIGVALYMAASAYDNLKDGEVLQGAADALTGAGFLAIATGNNKTGAALVGIGVALSIVDTLVDGKALSKDNLSKWLITAGGGAFMMSPPVGAALVTIGVGMQLMDENTWATFHTRLAILFGLIMHGIAIGVDALLEPLYTFIKDAIATWNKITFDDVKSPSFTNGLSALTQQRLDDLYKQLDGIGKEPVRPIAPPPVAQSGNYDYVSSGNGQVVQIQNLNITATDSGDLLRQLRARYGVTN